jgi:hypothetical protein
MEPEKPMLYFSQEYYASLVSLEIDLDGNGSLQRLHKRLLDLHRALYPRMKQSDFALYPAPETPGGVRQDSACLPTPANTMTLTYMRSHTEAELVEGLMGRDALSAVEHIESHRHPVIELRLSPDHFAVELVISPDAWYDQQNLIGKLSVTQHRNQFHQLLSELKADYLVGFWSGTHLDDTHLSTSRLPPSPILYEYLNTFADRRDWLRIGHWYDPDDPVLNADTIVDEVFERVSELYKLYTFLAWASENNFHSLYQKKTFKRSRR